MPCLNEAGTLPGCIAEAQWYIRENNLNAEILIADNGSTDGSAAIAEKCGVRVVKIPEKGYGAAILGGIEAAESTYIIMGDADGSYDFSAVSPLLTALRGGYSLVVGNRFVGGIEKGAMPFLHRIGVPILSRLARQKCRAPVSDFHCGLRGFDREEAQALYLSCKGMEFATEIIVAFAKSGAKICEVPVVLRRDKRGRRSHLRTFRDGFRHFKYIMSIPRRETTYVRRNIK